MIRLESVQNANDMAGNVADAIVGATCAVPPRTTLVLVEYDLRLQTVGLSIGYDNTIVRGDPRTRAFSVVYCKGRRVIALDCVNAPKDYVQGRVLVTAGAAPDPRALADPALPLKSLLC